MASERSSRSQEPGASSVVVRVSRSISQLEWRIQAIISEATMMEGGVWPWLGDLSLGVEFKAPDLGCRPTGWLTDWLTALQGDFMAG